MAKFQFNRKIGASFAITKLNDKGVAFMPSKKDPKKTLMIIDLDACHLTKHENGHVYLNLDLVEGQEDDDYGNRGFITQNIHKIGGKTYKESNDEERKAFKSGILGNFKIDDGGGTTEDTANIETSATPEDLPF